MPGLKKSRLRHALLLGCAVVGAHAMPAALAPAYAQAATREFKIPAQSLADALRAFANQTGRDVLFAPAIVTGKTSPGVRGALSEAAALQILLYGTGLTFQVTSTNGYAVLAQSATGPASTSTRVAQAEAQPTQSNSPSAASDNAPKADEGAVEKVTVTGSRIRGAKQASPVVTITRDDMRRQGANDLGEAVRGLPQNFNGGQNPGLSTGVGGGVSNQNITGSSSVNLRGLGPDATLTLLNGTRLPYDGFAQATDIAVIPIAAIERMEILLDGASAIYGSDAVGGVVNIILRRDYDGAELSVRRGRATDGGYDQQQYTALVGTNWASGGFFIAGDFSKAEDIDAGQRDFLSYLPRDFPVIGASEQKGGLFSGYQMLGSWAEVGLDAFYTERSADDFTNLAAAGLNFLRFTDSASWGISPSLRLELPGDWSLRLHGTVGQNHTDADARTLLPSGVQIGQTVTCYCNRAEAAGVEAEGPLFALPGGDIRLAIGGGYRRNSFDSINRLTGLIRPSGEDRSHYLYGEINLPLVSSDQAIPLVDRLSVNGSIRYEDYSSFGESTTPKIGAIWGVTPDIDLKATWGRSFKVPTLFQQFTPTRVLLSRPVSLGGVGYPAGSGVIFVEGGNPGLSPEKAETLAFGVVIRPEFLPGFKVEVSRFDVDYTDRVVQPFVPTTTALTNPASIQFVTFAPTVAQQNAMFALAGLPVGTFSSPPSPTLLPYDPTKVVAIADHRYINAASQQLTGVDLIASYSTDLFEGSFTASGNATWLERTQKLTSLAPELSASGLVFFPAEFRGRLSATWSSDGFTVASYINHIGGVTNNQFTPNVEGDAMTTVDLTINYVIESALWDNEIELNLAVTNLFNEQPPFMQPTFAGFVNYDSTNYSAIGRVVNATATVRF